MQIYMGKYWEIIYFDKCQDFLGRCIIASKKESIPEVTIEEWAELSKLEAELERICKKLFNATMFNFCCLMNNAYRDNTKPNVHFWFYPRYKEEVKIFDKKFKDIHFGYNFWKWNDDPEQSQKDIFTQEERNKIFKMIKEEFNITD